MSEASYYGRMPIEKDALSTVPENCSIALKEIFRSIADHSHVGIFLLDEKGLNFYTNKAGEEIWGHASKVGPDEYDKYVAWNYDTGERVKNEDWAGTKALLTGKPVLDDLLKIQRANGEFRVILNSAIPLKDESGKLIAILIINHDVTELKASEAKREELTRIVSHDLKNPLYAVQMASHVLQTKLDSYMATGNKEKIDHYIEVIKNSAGLCLQLIKDILDREKTEKGTFQIWTTKVQASDLFESFMQIYDPLAEQKGLTLIWNIPPSIEVYCDKERIGQVISNIVGNAIKFTPSGGEVRVSVTEVMEEIVFEIKDNGPGISCEHLKKIFHKNYQVQDNPVGTGLGLYIAQTIVEAHKGKIWADSDAGKGTTFYFTIPRH